MSFLPTSLRLLRDQLDAAAALRALATRLAPVPGHGVTLLAGSADSVVRQGLLGLAERLERPPVAPAGGILRAQALAEQLEEAAPERPPLELIWLVADALRICPPHAWGCPVVSKVQPERVAWTCRHCGEILVTGETTPPLWPPELADY